MHRVANRARVYVLKDLPDGRVRAVQAVTPVEQAFLDLALTAWRATNSVGKKQMRAQWSHILQPVPGAVSGALNRLASPKPIRARSNGG